MSPEKENTFRALKDEPLLVTSFFCRFGIHKWTKYGDPVGSPGLVYRVGMGYYRVMYQRKACASCNAVDHRKFYMYERD